MSDKEPRVAVLIPCYNEAQTIAKVVKDFHRALPKAKIYVYDNNSTDGTARKAKSVGGKYLIVKKEPKQGKGNVVRTMFREIDADVYLLVDGDDTYSAKDARKLVDSVANGADMVVGDRLSSTYTSENKRKFHNFGNFLVRKIINRIFKSNIKDVMTGYRAFSFLFVKTFPALSQGFEIETEMTIHAIDKNMHIENVVVQYRDRPSGSESKLDTVPDGIKVISIIFKLFRDYRPAIVFNTIAFILYLISLIFFIPVYLDYDKTGLVERFPTLIVCGFTFIAGTLSLFTGLILQAIVRNNRRDFEYKMQQVEHEYKSLKK